MLLRHVLVLACEIVWLVEAYFTEDFNQWLLEFYGPDVQTTLNRPDLGEAGSFGGRQFHSQVIKQQPIIFVHGVSNRAGDQPLTGALRFKYA
ncbi:unnamed protein product [Gongylonema pulchrum]|uniref:Uncharacterized protein n=1 Tax=Gongylonema pulchrum TaxID=637853 RepID=A0A183EHN6_9BILA|nr:unnamed protein product [Gongylonema pulchrum]